MNLNRLCTTVKKLNRAQVILLARDLVDPTQPVATDLECEIDDIACITIICLDYMVNRGYMPFEYALVGCLVIADGIRDNQESIRMTCGQFLWPHFDLSRGPLYVLDCATGRRLDVNECIQEHQYERSMFSVPRLMKYYNVEYKTKP